MATRARTPSESESGPASSRVFRMHRPWCCLLFACATVAAGEVPALAQDRQATEDCSQRVPVFIRRSCLPSDEDPSTADVPTEQPFVVVLMEARLVESAPSLDVAALATLTGEVLGQMGFVENEHYRLVEHSQPWDLMDVASDVLDESSSGPATNRFRKSILEATSYALPKGHGLIYIGGVSEWPTGRDHGSYMYAGQDVQFVSFCNGPVGFITCSIKEDCLGHELGHAFGMQHRRHNWYGFNPTEEHVAEIRRMTRCEPEPDHGYDIVWSEDTLESLED